MNKMKLNKVIGDGNIVIPLYILKYFKKMNLTMEEFIFLMYLYNKQDNIEFNPEKMALDLDLDIMEVMGYISILTDRGYLTLDVIKSENNIIEEVVNLSNFYERISTFLINSPDTEDIKDENILMYIEHELGRPLNSIEIDTINNWISNKIDIDLIKEAVKISLNDGVYNLKYIDKILLDFKTRSILNIKDLEDSKNKNIDNNSENNLDNLDMEIDDWNWLDDEEEYIIN